MDKMLNAIVTRVFMDLVVNSLTLTNALTNHVIGWPTARTPMAHTLVNASMASSEMGITAKVGKKVAKNIAFLQIST